ncbi:MAG TPA: glycosyltransferase family 4 protein [Planctomycetota bacterium]|jgi:glycosyltransferase involved in cell wall biosynthesis|nr:glycosyltransferase family 4 protein [Planctomycetota bacterium]OQC21681.1 MAG: Capsular glucan synthase [Planctomycetes bacterium ADurb.Bin069]HNR98939.1 glycosyltransferase family 4 protein [Planctomycetota bacterium]HNU26443.1 glycosyltransferase family 4 protein [Planctomycetota bacterium]HOE29651.1 glycosyltransferase family 4 protein [Planctomycetota bacterium]
MAEPLRVAMLGQRGCPPLWGGIERHVTEIAAALAARGHRVTVYARAAYRREARARGLGAPPGVRVRVLPAVRAKHLEALTHTLAAAVAAAGSHDVLHFHGIGPGSVAAAARFLAPHARRVLTVHALDWRRDRWEPWARGLLRRGEAVAVRSARRVIAVSEDIARYLEARYGVAAAVIPNGVEAPVPRPPGPRLAALGLAPRRYVLSVGRLVPEKGLHVLVRAFAQLRTDWRLVMAGPAQDPRYARALRAAAAACPRILFPGTFQGADLQELYSNAGAFALPSRIEGFPIALLEAVSYGLPVIASAIPGVREALAAAGVEDAELCAAGDAGALAAGLARVLARPAPARVRARGVPAGLSWEAAAARTEQVYRAAAPAR